MHIKQSKSVFQFVFVIAIYFLCPSLVFADQGAWSYALVPEVNNSDASWHPEASLASNNSLPLPVTTKGTNIGYISIARRPSIPEEVMFSVEGSLGELNCPSTGCSLQVSFDGGTPIAFLAEEYYEIMRGKAYRLKETLRLKDAPSFIAKIARAKSISVTFNSKLNGTATFNFSAVQPLRFPTDLKRLNS